MVNPIVIYTDGACKGNGKKDGGAGGYGVHITYPNGDIQDIWGGDADTTNNRMELQAAIVALERTPAQMPVQIWTDSSYVKNGITTWIQNWKQKHWKKADGKAPLNLELWQRLDGLCQNRIIDWRWIKGHAGHVGNEKADQLANLGVNENGEMFTPAHTAQHNTAPAPSLSEDEQYYAQLSQLDDNLPQSSPSKPKSTPADGFVRHYQQNPDACHT